MADKDEELYDAAQNGKLPDVQRLLTEGASPDAEKYKQPALGVASQTGHLEVVRVLLRAGAKLEATNLYGSIALMLAASSGKHDCAEFLLGAGADVHAADRKGDLRRVRPAPARWQRSRGRPRQPATC